MMQTRIKFYLKVSGILTSSLFSSLVIISVTYYLVVGRTLDQSSHAWVDNNFPKMVRLVSRDHDALVKNKSVVLNSLALEQLKQSIRGYPPFKRYTGSQGEATVIIKLGLPVVTAEYVVATEFDKEIVNFKVVLARKDGMWYAQQIIRLS